MSHSTPPYMKASTVPQRDLPTPAGAWRVAIRGESCDPEELARELQSALEGEVRFDSLAQAVYSSDASIYQLLPLGVVTPKDETDLIKLATVCSSLGASMTGRGAGTSLAGQACGHGVIADVSQHLCQILEVDTERSRVRLQPGVVLDHLNKHLESFDLFFGPDVATSSRATLGGMVNNNSSGARSILYGMTLHHVDRVRAILADSTVLDWSPFTREELDRRRQANSREGEILRGLIDILEKYREEIRERFPKVLRKVGGYPLDHLLEQYEGLKEDPNATFNPARIFCGSEGTLGLVSELTLNLVPLQREKTLILLEFGTLQEALSELPRLVEIKPSAVELLDHNILGKAMESPGLRDDVSVLSGSPAAILIVEFCGTDAAELGSRVDRAFQRIAEIVPRAGRKILRDPADQNRVWNIRKAGLGMMMRRKGHTKPCAFIEDAAIPLKSVGAYVADLWEALDGWGLKAGAYAHASVGLLHIRPILNLYTEEGVRQLRKVAEKSVELSLKYRGSFSGEHGDGMARSEFLPTTHGEVLCQAFKEVKQLFDPHALMNPGKIVDPYPMDTNLRSGADYAPPEVRTLFSYEADGSFSNAIDLCSGVGQCRNRMVATMCPSYMATRNEFHTTRARANALRNALNGRLPFQFSRSTPGDLAWATDEVMEALDLCLSCKACKTECPTGVDMARWKAEALHVRHQSHGTGLAERLVADYPRQAAWGSAFAPLSNLILRSLPGRILAEKFLGFDRSVPLPAFHRRTFRKWFAAFETGAEGKAFQQRNRDRPVVYFVDTFMNHHRPEVGIAAVRLLSRLGYRVHVVEHRDEGRTALSKGFLDLARKLARENVALLKDYPAKGIPIVGTEPSSILTFRDEVPDLVPGQDSRQLADHTWTLAEFLWREQEKGEWVGKWDPIPGIRKILFHGHCHAKALAQVQAPVRLMNLIPDASAKMIDAGCCGMAGAFGHEKGHSEVARLVGEERLFPAIRAAEEGTLICAEGFSCHHQMQHHIAGLRVHHYAEVLAASVQS